MGAAVSGVRATLAIIGALLASGFPEIPIDLIVQVVDDILTATEIVHQAGASETRNYLVKKLVEKCPAGLIKCLERSPSLNCQDASSANKGSETWRVFHAHPP